MNNYTIIRSDELYHHGILGQKWGIRRYQNPDGSLTFEGKERYSKGSLNQKMYMDFNQHIDLRNRIYKKEREKGTPILKAIKIGYKEANKILRDERGETAVNNAKIAYAFDLGMASALIAYNVYDIWNFARN